MTVVKKRPSVLLPLGRDQKSREAAQGFHCRAREEGLLLINFKEIEEEMKYFCFVIVVSRCILSKILVTVHFFF